MKLAGFIAPSHDEICSVIHDLTSEFLSRNVSVAVLRENTASPERTFLPVPAGEMSPEGYCLTLPGGKSLEDALSYLEADIVLVDGFQTERMFPRIVCCPDSSISSEQREEALALCTWGGSAVSGTPRAATIQELAVIIQEKAFKLPKLDCGHCGCSTCEEFARKIIRGETSPSGCVSLKPLVEVRFGSFALPMNPFISSILEKTVRGLLSSLKGSRPGPVSLHIP